MRRDKAIEDILKERDLCVRALNQGIINEWIRENIRGQLTAYNYCLWRLIR